jgi:hypothetical protein
VPDADHPSLLMELCREDGTLRAVIGEFDRTPAAL